MLYTSLLLIATRFALTMPLTFSPLVLGLWVLTTATILAAFVAIRCSRWFGLILFLIYVGGILVIFSYFAAISPNQQVPISLLILALLSTFLILSTILFSQTTFFQFASYTASASQTIITYLYTPHIAPILVALACLLLLALILVVKIARRSEGPLRPFN